MSGSGNESYRLDVWFDGQKVFWGSRSTMELTLVEHLDLSIVEIIGFDPLLKAEAPRLYIDRLLLQNSLLEAPSSGFQEHDATHSLNKKPLSPNSKPVTSLRDRMKEFLLIRIQIMSDDLGSNSRQQQPGPLAVSLVPHLQDKLVNPETGLLTCQILPPPNLRPAVVKRLAV